MTDLTEDNKTNSHFENRSRLKVSDQITGEDKDSLQCRRFRIGARDRKFAEQNSVAHDLARQNTPAG